ncbi:shikimate dehydrogenase [Thermosyntropha sp.]|uniref:shikimate dehydrogenase n=1 Tax=Thermosyntropha sp. TaxID=2740820 RepID=UPI0025FF55A5|nr:shikimate dehydrogenase [Thermosyntropha sp.]MBO8159259.1 shikimate dehydrogenase [Thermosyntropha sp.]
MLITANTKVIGLFGYPLKHTLSPLMHNAVLEKMGLDYVYIPFEVNPGNVKDAVKSIKSLNFLGVNVTVPFKEEVIAYLDELSDEALACQAVNLIKNDNGRLIGDNTDGKGFLESLKEEGIPLKGKAVIIGAGGAARAISYTMAKAGFAPICFFDLNGSKAEALAEFIENKTGIRTAAGTMSEDVFLRESGDADIIINCSPVGMYPDIEALPVKKLDGINPDAVICDIVYNPLETLFLRKAKEKGHKVVNGIGMFVYQGALTLQILTGFNPPVELMKEVVYRHVRGRKG